MKQNTQSSFAVAPSGIGGHSFVNGQSITGVSGKNGMKRSFQGQKSTHKSLMYQLKKAPHYNSHISKNRNQLKLLASKQTSKQTFDALIKKQKSAPYRSQNDLNKESGKSLKLSKKDTGLKGKIQDANQIKRDEIKAMLLNNKAVNFHNLMSSVDVQSEPSDECSDISIQFPEDSPEKLEEISSSSCSPFIESEGPFNQLREEKSFSQDRNGNSDVNDQNQIQFMSRFSQKMIKSFETPLKNEDSQLDLFNDKNAVNLSSDDEYVRQSGQDSTVIQAQKPLMFASNQAQFGPIWNEWGMTTNQSQDELKLVSNMNIASPTKNLHMLQPSQIMPDQMLYMEPESLIDPSLIQNQFLQLDYEYNNRR